MREDARAGSLVTTDGDNVALRGNNFGELYVKHTDTIAATQSGTWNIATVTTLTTLSQFAGAAINLDNGAASTGTLRVTIANDSTGIVSLTTSTASIGKLAANSGVDIGDVDVTSVIPGTGATNLGKAIDTATGATDTGVLVLATRDDALSALTPIESDNVQLRVDANGALWCILSGTVTVASHAVTNAGTFAVQIDAGAVTSLALIDDVIFTDDAAFTPATSKVAAVGMQADETATDSVDEGDIGCPRMTLDRKQISSLYAHTAGGWTPYSFLSAAGANQDSTVVKASAGQIGWLLVTNTNAAVRYLKIYNKATGPTSADTPLLRFAVPGNTAGSGATFNVPAGLVCTTGISFRMTTGAADNDANAVAANEIILNLGYL